MAIGTEIEAELAAKFASLFPHLDERQRRLAMDAEARVLGHGGIEMSGLSISLPHVSFEALRRAPWPVFGWLGEAAVGAGAWPHHAGRFGPDPGWWTQRYAAS